MQEQEPSRADHTRSTLATNIELVRKVLVLGASGSGKSTVSRTAADRLGAPHVELDALHHGPGWVPRPTFAADVDAATAGHTWVIDGNYSAVRDLVWARADTVVWLDLPRWLVEWQVTTRTARRLLLRTPLWHGNRERWRDIPHASHPIRWAWRKHGEYRRNYGARFASASDGEKTLVRLRSRREIRGWLSALAPDSVEQPSRQKNDHDGWKETTSLLRRPDGRREH